MPEMPGADNQDTTRRDYWRRTELSPAGPDSGEGTGSVHTVEANAIIDYQRAWEIEKELQRRQIKRLGLDWTTGEPYYVLVENEITKLRAALEEKKA
jgi:hypothetical protein